MEQITGLVKLIDNFAVSSDACIILPYELTNKQRAAVHDYASKIPGIYTESISTNTSSLKMIKVWRGDMKNVPHAIDSHDIEAFVIYSDIPVPCPHVDFINSYVETLDPLYDSVRRWDLYKSEYRTILTKGTINEASKKIRSNIQQHPSFAKLLSQRHNASQNQLDREIYIYDNIGKTFMSIDIRCANFSILQYMCPDIFGGATWEEYVARFTTSKFIQESKPFREIVLGGIGYSKISNAIQSQIIHDIHLLVAKQMELKIVMKKGDEVVYELDTDLVEQEGFAASMVKLYEMISSQKFGNIFHLKIFKLENLEKKPYYIKKYVWNSSDPTMTSNLLWHKIEFKCVPKKFIIQALRKYLGQPVKNEELYFMDDGILAKYEYPVFEYSLDIGR